MTATAQRTIDDVLAEARGRLQRLTALQAWEAQHDGAVLIDIRPQANRVVEGTIPGAVPIERTVLEWRLDPSCDSCLPWASHDALVVIVCNEGYSSSLAACALQDLGIGRATDVIGGFRAWQAAGLPVEDAGEAFGSQDARGLPDLAHISMASKTSTRPPDAWIGQPFARSAAASSESAVTTV